MVLFLVPLDEKILKANYFYCIIIHLAETRISQKPYFAEMALWKNIPFLYITTTNYVSSFTIYVLRF